jgi:hypothetical protein
MARRVGQSKTEMGLPSKPVIVLAVVGAIVIIAVRRYQQLNSQDPMGFLSA